MQIVAQKPVQYPTMFPCKLISFQPLCSQKNLKTKIYAEHSATSWGQIQVLENTVMFGKE